jgi:hypothetical protein
MNPERKTPRETLTEAQERYSALVDKKFACALSESEEGELRSLERVLDQAEAKLYEPFEAQLEAKIEKLEKRRAWGGGVR